MSFMKNIHSIFILALISLFIQPSFAQDLFKDRHGVKLGVIAAYNRDIRINYEYVPDPHIGINIDGGFLIPRNSPYKRFTDGIQIGNTGGGFGYKFGGHHASIEARNYFAGKAPHGFYMAPYFKYSNYNFRYNMFVTEDFTDGPPNTYQARFHVGMRTMGVGLQMGMQWLIHDRVSIDWYFYGMGWDFHTLHGGLEFQTGPKGDETIHDLIKDIESEFTDTPVIGDKVELEVDPNNLNFRVPFGLPAIRTGLRIGYFF